MTLWEPATFFFPPALGCGQLKSSFTPGEGLLEGRGENVAGRGTKKHPGWFAMPQTPQTQQVQE